MSSNPFATRFIRPGAIPFLFLDGDSAEAIVERLRGQNWWGQIIGPHGSGKSTLLATLMPHLEANGRSVLSFKIGPGERRLPHIDPFSLSLTTQIVIDGYEQLSWWSKWQTRRIAQRTNAGLLITAHKNGGFPAIYATNPSEAVAFAVVERLTATHEQKLSREKIVAAYQAVGGDVREALFRLYDVHLELMANRTDQE